MVYREDALLKLAPVTIDPARFRTVASGNMSEYTALLRKTARDVHIPTQLPFELTLWQQWGGYIGLASLGIIILVVLLLFVKWKRQPVLSLDPPNGE